MQQLLEVIKRFNKLRDIASGRGRGVSIRYSTGALRNAKINTRRRGTVATASLHHSKVKSIKVKNSPYGESIVLELRQPRKTRVNVEQMKAALSAAGYDLIPEGYVFRGKVPVAVIHSRIFKRFRFVQSAEIDSEHFQQIARAVLDSLQRRRDK